MKNLSTVINVFYFRLVSRIERRTEITENIVIDHSKQSDEEIAAILDEFEKRIKEAEDEEEKDDVVLEELMAPDTVSKIWPWLSLKELKNRPIKMPPSQTTPPCLTPQKPSCLMANSISPRAKAHPSPQKFNRAVSFLDKERNKRLTKTFFILFI